jgi:hypothetical protein
VTLTAERIGRITCGLRRHSWIYGIDPDTGALKICTRCGRIHDIHELDRSVRLQPPARHRRID